MSLNLCHAFIAEAGAVPALVAILEEGTCDRLLAANAIHAAGPQGDLELLKVPIMFS